MLVEVDASGWILVYNFDDCCGSVMDKEEEHASGQQVVVCRQSLQQALGERL